MDSQHRHELQQNDLRKLTNKALPFFERHGLKLALAVGVVVVAVVGGGVWYNINSTATAEAWTQFDRVLHEQNPSSGDFAAMAEKYPGSAIAGWSRLKEADALLKSGLETAFTNRAASQADLKAAQGVYEKLVDGAGISPDVRERAMFGLARTLESLSDGDTAAAAKAYARLTSEFSSSIFAGVAKERIAALESPESKDFYAWFQKQELKPKDRAPVHPFTDPKDEADDAANKSSDKSDTANEVEQPADERDESESNLDGDAESSDESTDDASKTDSP